MRRNIKKIIFGVVIVIGLCSSAYWIYHHSSLFQRALEKKVLSLFREHWAKKVPFRLDQVRIKGRTLALDLSLHGVSLHLEGEVDAKLSTARRTLDLKYRPEVRVVTRAAAPLEGKAEGVLQISAVIDPFEPENLRFEISGDFKPFSIQPKDRTDRVLGLGHSHIDAKLLNQDIEVLLRTASLELLWDRHYLSFEKIDHSITAKSEGGLNQKWTVNLIDPTRTSPVAVVRTDSLAKGDIRLQSDRIEMKSLFPIIAEGSGLPLFSDWSDIEGTVQAQAQFDLHAQAEKMLKAFHVDLVRFGARLRKATLQLKDITLSLDQENFKIKKGLIGFRRLRAKLNPIQIDIPIRSKQTLSFPITFENIDLSFGPLGVQFESLESYHFTTAMRLKDTPIAPILDRICITTGKDLPASIQGEFSTIDIDSEMADFSGKIRLSVFDGFLDVEDMTLFDYFDDVPETQLSAHWDQIKLDQAANWANFGKIDGILYGHAKDVVLERLFPTRFDFLLSAKPHLKHDIVLSPDAMKNFVRLVAEDALYQIPKFAQFFAFGWPSRVFGGYDVDYAGISMFSSGGAILLETLDPKEVYRTQQKHFILYGNRFKMPLESRQYPVILDATAVGNFVHRVVNTLVAIRENEESATPKKEPQDDPIKMCQPSL